MLRINQLSGFGHGPAEPEEPTILSVTTGNALSLSVDLGPVGRKQVFLAVACTDNLGADPWDWGTGSVGGEPFTYAVPSGDESAGTGGTFTAGATIRAMETELGGTKTVTIPIQNFWGVMNSTVMLVIVATGFDAAPISYDGGNNQGGGSAGSSAVLNTAGAKLVLVAGSASFGNNLGNFRGGGNPTNGIFSSPLGTGYDDAPSGGAADVYDFQPYGYVISGAAFG